MQLFDKHLLGFDLESNTVLGTRDMLRGKCIVAESLACKYTHLVQSLQWHFAQRAVGLRIGLLPGGVKEGVTEALMTESAFSAQTSGPGEGPEVRDRMPCLKRGSRRAGLHPCLLPSVYLFVVNSCPL